MNKSIRVECWADNYFFGRLLTNKSLIRKEKNKSEVFKSIKERAKGIFSIGIVDSDNDNIEPFLGDLEIEERFFVCDELELIKIRGFSYFILQLHPKEFEKWLLKYIENAGQKLSDFGYSSYKEFENDSKVIPERMERNERFLNLINFVLDRCDETDNHINKMKKILQYLIEHTYSVDINDLKNV
jgi:hypothetical protein